MQRTAQQLVVLAFLMASLGGVTIVSTAAQNLASSDEVVLEDSFDNPATSLFQTEDAGIARIAHQSGRLRFDAHSLPPAGNMSADLPLDARDGTVEIDARLIDGTVDEYVAVGCRGSLNTYDAGYTFMVSPVDRYIGLYRREHGISVFMDGLYLNPVASSPLSMDRIGLTCHGVTVTGWLNGVEVISVTDDQHSEGYFYIETGMFADAGGDPTAEFDNLTVSLPAEERDQQRMRTVAFSNAIDSLAAEARTHSPLTGPQHGVIPLDGLVGMYPTTYVGVEVDDFYATVRFQSATDATTHPWDGVFIFEQTGFGTSYWVLVSSAGFWEVMDSSGTYLAKGMIPELDQSAGSPILLEFAAVGDVGGVRINGTIAAQFELVNGASPGGVGIGSGMLSGNNRAGEAIFYDQLQVWAVDTPTRL